VKQPVDMPLVSCILATGNRPRFLQQAITLYRQQSLASSELIIVDDSDTDAPPKLPDSAAAAIHYIALREPTPIGTKLNIGIARSRGTIIQKLDDDDWYHPTFLRRTSDALIAHGTSDAMVAADTFLVLVLGQPTLFHAGGGWFAGATLAFFRQLWERRPFRDIAYREDGCFLDDHAEAAQLRLHDPELFIAVRHDRNTWNRLVQEPSVPRIPPDVSDVTDFFLQCPRYERSLDEVMGPVHAEFYRTLSAEYGRAATW
jgi:glycosyltransferase involved in cell wall biosynthesis